MRFILVDRIVELTPGERILATKYIRPDEEFFRDHFPGFPVVPGVLLTEMMAQAAGKCLDAQNPARGKAMLIHIRSAHFRQWVGPGNHALIHASIKSNLPQCATATCHIEVDNTRIADAELLFAFVPLEKFGSGYHDAVLADFLSHAQNRR